MDVKPEHQWRVLKQQLARFVAGGLTTTVLCWGLLVFFVEKLHIHYLVSANVAAGIAYGYAYLINKYLVFGNRKREHVRQVGKFAAAQAVLWVLGNSGMYVAVEVFGLHYLAANVIVAGFAAVINFLLMKFIVFA